MNAEDRQILEEMFEYHQRVQSWRKVGQILGRSGGYAMQLCAALPGWAGASRPIALKEEDRHCWRAFRAGKPIQFAPAPVCPSCGEIHAIGDCGGARGRVVFVVEGFRIAKQRAPRRIRRIADIPSEELGRMIRERTEYAFQD